LRGAVHRRVRRRGNAELGDEILFDQAILRDLQNLRIGQHLPAPAEQGRGLGRHVFEFVGDDVDRGGKPRQRPLIVIRSAGGERRHLEGAGVLLRRIDVALEAEPRRGKRQHAPELAAAENADGGARLQHIPPLIPAQAGIQLFGLAKLPWIPACAGMSGVGSRTA